MLKIFSCYEDSFVQDHDISIVTEVRVLGHVILSFNNVVYESVIPTRRVFGNETLFSI